MSLLRAAHSPANPYPPSSPSYAPPRPPLRIFASGTLFLTHTLLVSSYPEAGAVSRAQTIRKTRGGHSGNVLSVLAQFRAANSYLNGFATPGLAPAPGARTVGDVQFCGPLAGCEEGAMVGRELEAQGVGMRFCTVREGKGVPAAWVVEAGDGTKTVINHNPLPDMTHEEFVSRLGPMLAPENYDLPSPPLSSPAPSSSPHPHANHTRKRSSSGHNTSAFPTAGTPPFDWLHFEGRTVQTTLANLTGLDGLARERGWRARCVFSLEVSRPGVEPLIAHADVVFFSKHYALSLAGPQTQAHTSPRSFLIAMSAHASPHALLVVDWGAQGAALLSVPTREYLQSSGWVEPRGKGLPAATGQDGLGLGSVRSGSGFWADGRPASGVTITGSEKSSQWTENGINASLEKEEEEEEERCANAKFVDEVGAHEAFVAGMVYALSQRIVPGRPYAPGAGDGGAPLPGSGSGRWRLEECLRFATELAGRRGRRTDFSFHGLRTEMERAGWVVE